MIYQNILECVGHTPMVRLSRMVGENSAQVLVKYEGLNVGGSIKSRTALAMLEAAEREEAFGRELLAQSLLFQFLIGLNRAMAGNTLQYAKPAAYDRKIESILRYLSAHLTEPVSIDDLAARFFVSKYHMMRQFRAQTGYTIHGYLTGKRLMRARAMIAAGTPVLQASEESGFGDYSAFLRAYRKQFGTTPNQEKRAN